MSNQGTPEWFKLRAGKFTGSRFADVLARDKRTGKHLKCWHDLCEELATERIYEAPTESVSSQSLAWGHDCEPFGREAYEFATGNIVIESDFIIHHSLPFVGCSPDGLIGTDGGIEIKSPKSPRIHLARFIDGMPDEYAPQVQGCMWVTGRQWWDFASFDPRAPERFRLYVTRIERDDAYISRLEEAVIEANSHVEKLIARLTEAA